MKENLINAYKNLALNDKRNECNQEIKSMYNIIEEYLHKHKLQSNYNPYNYDYNSDANKTEEEMLTILYSDLIELKKNLLLFLQLNEYETNEQ